VYRRGEYVIALNLSEEPVEVKLSGETIIATGGRDVLEPGEGVLIRG
jgi:hypothetical protein